ncbi:MULTISPECIES: hypothetical protein [Streptomyces]|uniref:WXG100 family type VII secretion target n=1 Tax=Streptomyces xanthochromogenes TaxID=67384 RepID=A0ABQ2ZWR2_9ACTN|nr:MULTISPECIES: hypothetical protein [Streptomyces]GGY28343.1 hypothetical protein GCM10010326_22480 [Streptomyces xanthochromogenes]
MAGTEPGSGTAAQPVAMRLNQIPGDVGGSQAPPSPPGGQKLVSTPAQKQAAANAIEQHIEPDTRKAGDYADTETNSAVSALHGGWHTSGALKKAHAAWGTQVTNLMNMLGADKAALRSTTNTLQTTDYHAAAHSDAVSVFSGY